MEHDLSPFIIPSSPIVPLSTTKGGEPFKTIGMKKCFSKLLCKRREMYAEVYSQAYSLSAADDDYLAKQRYVPSSTSFLSSNEMSLYSADSDADFNAVVASVDLIQLGNDQKPKKPHNSKTNLGMTSFATMGIKTVTSIGDEETVEFDIETFLEEDGTPEIRISPKEKIDGLKVDAMAYHVTSKHCAKSTRGRFLGASKAKISPLQRVKKQLMKAQHFDMIPEEIDKVPTGEMHGGNENMEMGDRSSRQRDRVQDFTILRNLSSTSGLYIDNEHLASF